MFILYEKRIVNKKYKKNNFVTKPYGCALFNLILKPKIKYNHGRNDRKRMARFS